MNAWRLWIFVLMLAAAAPVVACDVDLDCGPGGTCIKREKRARGVCYGGNIDRRGTGSETRSIAPSAPTVPEGQYQAPPVAPKAQSGSAFDQSLDAPVYGEDPSVTPAPAERTLVPMAEGGIAQPESDVGLDPGARTGRNTSSCITTSECPAGLECVYTDPLNSAGECVVFE